MSVRTSTFQNRIQCERGLMIYFTFDFELLFMIVLVAWVVSRVLRSVLHGNPYFWREIMLWGLFFYVAFLLYNTFEPFVILLERQNQWANLVPLQGILRMIESASRFDDGVTRRIVFVNLVGNILIFSPLGFMIPLLEKRLNRGWLVVLLGLSFSIVIELAQTFLEARVFDVDDLMLNTFGTLLGFVVYAILNSIKPIRSFFERIRDAARPRAFLYAVIFLLIVAGAAVGIYHYGYYLYRQIPQ